MQNRADVLSKLHAYTVETKSFFILLTSLTRLSASAAVVVLFHVYRLYTVSTYCANVCMCICMYVCKSIITIRVKQNYEFYVGFNYTADNYLLQLHNACRARRAIRFFIGKNSSLRFLPPTTNKHLHPAVLLHPRLFLRLLCLLACLLAGIAEELSCTCCVCPRVCVQH